MRSDGRLRLNHPAIAVPSSDGEGSDFASAVGQSTHVLVAELAARRADSRGDLLDFVWARSASVVTDARLGRRTRAARIAAAAAAAVYVDRFLPTSDWELLGSEFILGCARADLVWASALGILVDELKTADARTAGRASGRTHAQTDTYRTAATQLFGERFLGVRLIYLAAASHSVLVLPNGGRSPLSDSPYALGQHERVDR